MVQARSPDRAGSSKGVVECTMSKRRDVSASIGGHPTRFQAQVSGPTGTRRSTNVAPFSSRSADGAGRSRHEELQRVSSTPAAAGSPRRLQGQQVERELVHPLADTGPVSQGRPVVEQQMHHGVLYPTAKGPASPRRESPAGCHSAATR